MKISGTSSYLLIEVNDRVAKFQGEMLVNGFAAYIDSLKNWEPPFENEPIDDAARQRIID